MSSLPSEFFLFNQFSSFEGRRLYSEAFYYYSEYFCLNFIDPARVEILHLLSIYMQIGKYFLVKGPLIEKEEEEKLTQLLSDLHQSFLYGELRQKDLPIHLKKVLENFCQNNLACQLIWELMKLERRVLFEKKLALTPLQKKEFKAICNDAFLKMTTSLPHLICKAVSRGLNRLNHDGAMRGPFMSEFKQCIQLLNFK